MSWKPRTFLALLVASMGCWLERKAVAQIEYLKAENRLLRSRLGRRRVLFSDAERHALATLAKEIGTRVLRDIDPLVPSDPIALASGPGRAEMDVSRTTPTWQAPHQDRHRATHRADGLTRILAQWTRELQMNARAKERD